MIHELEKLIQERKTTPKDGSYTTYLFESGVDKIAKKFGEESFEVVIAALQDENVVEEAADVIYHLLVLLAAKGVSLEDVETLLSERHGTTTPAKPRRDVEDW
ncbi:MAG: phosphoribosyl-ATP diphosphatase [Exiguobacterium sp.]|uniref:Phosphoribosyl-ATP pyrophosphatase n=2 Tax=Exiguobacterium TaxID=33986 RepID=A0A377FU91_9BACL|nr:MULTISPECIES: phosphoribosyl-ATP diphosphatase [Exiguobacterium]MCT4795226.1 phosphoribosyl-ATP diphosphatase [Exiguobacterium alkaliphilum]MDX5324440.1 phosphoribosyl-ATP diphosphatase [Exiguobacterium sp.]KDN59259.1 phosphoribosyl-ATP pyrophosphatase [Exiguobacterium sp. AB2]MDX5426284.1 phosphoribosyl-ATP diphosphatase [Exiguobacterium sp.]MDX6773657.1 phosphoribosyl-ATP diphosphatase [Exiguobacterium sp.]